jgi:hypothetical protein
MGSGLLSRAMRLKGPALFIAGCGFASLLSGCFMLEIGAAMSSSRCPADKMAPKNKTVVVCEDGPETGSHIGRPRCYRQVQRDEQGEADREEIRRLQTRGGTATEPQFRPQPQPQPRAPGPRRSRT